jgi:hypothetical protein
VRKNCDGKNCKGEWYAKDIKQIRAGEIPKAEIWTFGFPCTDYAEEKVIPKFKPLPLLDKGLRSKTSG